jgi:bacteriophage exclusion system BrxC/D-like protein
MSATAILDPAVARRRAVEALRAGVPSRDAVAVLGSGQTTIEDRFAELRESASAGTPGGLLLGGGFGTGKSHLLEHLAGLALGDGFAVSRVVISKETPLHDPVKVFRAAADTAITAAGSGPAIAEAAAELDVEARGYAELLRWAGSAAADLNERFPATLELFARVRDRDAEVAESIVRFWSGDPIRVPDLRRHLRQIGLARPVLPPVPAKELSRQRLRFAAKLLAAGCAGWVILFDEVELIGRYTLLQRAKSYAEIARWIRGEHGAPAVPIAAVLAMTDDFEAAVITGKGDLEQVPAKLRAKDTQEAGELAAAAEVGMRIVDRDMTLLVPPDAAELDQAYRRLKQLHADAFGWQPPDVAGLERLGATRMRQYVRAWINEWDLVRLDPRYQPNTEAVDVVYDYREDEALAGEPVAE